MLCRFEKRPDLKNSLFHTAKMPVLTVFCGPHLPLAFHFDCGPGVGGLQTKWKASGRFFFIWLRRRRRPRDTVQIVVLVGAPLWETIVPLGNSLMKACYTIRTIRFTENKLRAEFLALRSKALVLVKFPHREAFFDQIYRQFFAEFRISEKVRICQKTR